MDRRVGLSDHEDLPAVAVRVGGPKFVLDGVAAGDGRLDLGSEASGLYTRLPDTNRVGALDLDPEVLGPLAVARTGLGALSEKLTGGSRTSNLA